MLSGENSTNIINQTFLITIPIINMGKIYYMQKWHEGQVSMKCLEQHPKNHQQAHHCHYPHQSSPSHSTERDFITHGYHPFTRLVFRNWFKMIFLVIVALVVVSLVALPPTQVMVSWTEPIPVWKWSEGRSNLLVKWLLLQILFSFSLFEKSCLRRLYVGGWGLFSRVCRFIFDV